MSISRRGTGTILQRLLLFVLAFMITAIVLGILLGIVGLFNWWIGIPIAVGVATVVSRRVDLGASQGPTAGALGWVAILIAGLTVLSLMNPGEHLFTSRDSGTYTATASWLANEGEFQVLARQGPFQSDRNLTFSVPGFYDLREDGKLSPEFFHGYPVLLAYGYQIGGVELMLAMTPIIGALSLLAVYALAGQMVGWWWAILSVVLLGSNQVFMYFTRAPFSETLALFFIAGGSYLLLTDQNDSRANRILGGIILGASALVRVDSLLILLPLLLLVALRGEAAEWATPVLRGFGWVAAFGLTEVLLISPWYLGKLDNQLLLIAGAGALILLLQGVPSRWRSLLVEFLGKHSRPLAVTVMFGVLFFAPFAFVLRPTLLPAVGSSYDLAPIQEAEGLPVDSNRTYAELSVRWLGWYLGLPTLAASLGGLLLMVWTVRSRPRVSYLFWTGTWVFVTAVYLWRPSINPDHIWAMRRFIPIVLPGLAISAVLFLGALAKRTSRAWAAVGALVVLAIPLGIFSKGWAIHEFEGLSDSYEEACRAIGDDAALLILDTSQATSSQLVLQGFRSYCGVPVAAVSNDVEIDLASLSRGWRSEGRQLVLATTDAEMLRAAGSRVEGVLFPTPYPILEYTLARRPQRMVYVDASMVFGREPVIGG